MADGDIITDKHSGQKSKVIFPDGRELFVRGHEEIGADILQKAFDDASGSPDDHLAMNGKSCYDAPDASDFIIKDFKEDESGIDNNGIDNGEPFLAIYEGENGQTRTVRLTAEQAESMGIQFTSDAEHRDISQLEFTDQLQIEQLPDGMTQIYSEVPENEDQVLFQDHDINETLIFEDSEIIHTSQENEEHLISSMSGVLNENGNQQLTLSIPQVINGKVTYTVKVSDELQPSIDALSKFNAPISVKPDQKHNTLQLTAQTIAPKRTPMALSTSMVKGNSSISKAQSSLTDQCSRTITVKQSLIKNKRQKYLIETRPKVLTNIVTPKVLTPSQMTGIPLYDSAVVKISSELPARTKPSVFLSSKSTPPIPTINAKPRETTVVAKPKATGNVTAGKFTHVMASDGQLVSGSATEQGEKQMSSELSEVLTKMMPRQIDKAKPLGSSENPIQLVQHGQTFHSVQSLNQEQLKQIATVLQRQHLESPPRASKNVLYNAETNTRIIYRVVYPEDLKDSAAIGPGKGKRGRPRKVELGKPDARIGKEDGDDVAEDQKAKRPRGRPRKSEVRPKSPNSSTQDELPTKDDAEDMGEEAQERKRQVARTRSGRVSRPPRHMVKDYKRLHRLDPSEPDVDDSDGGYSDYQTAEPVEPVAEDVRVEPATEREPNLLTGLPTVKRNISSSNRCPTCQKIYLGHSRMAHHFEVFPDHRVAAEELREPVVPVQEKPLHPPLTKKKKKGPWAYMTAEARSDRRKLKLREMLATLEPGELAEVAGPALAGELATWDLLLLRVHAARTAHGHAAAFCSELAAVIAAARGVAATVLRPVGAGEERLGDEMQLDDPLVCSALSLPRGLYHVDDGPLRQPAPPSQRSPPAPDGSSPPCPELLTALTLVAKKPAPPKPSVDKELLLPADLISLPGPHADTIDDIVNERLENLAGDGLCDYVSSPMAVNGRSPEMLATLDRFQSNESKSVWEKEKAERPFDEPDLRMDDSGNEQAAAEGGYDAEMALDIGSDRATAAEFDSEMELAGIGDEEREGDSANMSGVSFDPSDSLMEDDEVEFASNVNSSTGSYDRAMSLAEMQESGSSKPSDESPNESRTFPGLGLADVSLDESGPELDFEALSEEFNRNTRHSS